MVARYPNAHEGLEKYSRPWGRISRANLALCAIAPRSCPRTPRRRLPTCWDRGVRGDLCNVRVSRLSFHEQVSSFFFPSRRFEIEIPSFPWKKLPSGSRGVSKRKEFRRGWAGLHELFHDEFHAAKASVQFELMLLEGLDFAENSKSRKYTRYPGITMDTLFIVLYRSYTAHRFSSWNILTLTVYC